MCGIDDWIGLRLQCCFNFECVLILLNTVSKSVIAKECGVALGEVPLWRTLLRAVYALLNLESLNKHDAADVTSVSQSMFPLPVSGQQE